MFGIHHQRISSITPANLTMAPTLEYYDEVSHDLPIKPVAAKVNGVPAVAAVQLDGSEKHNLVLRYFRAYIADLCQQFNGGHPGYVICIRAKLSVLTFYRSAMGMAAIGVALYKYVMKFSPKNGSYFNRDRFVLSNGASHQARENCLQPLTLS